MLAIANRPVSLMLAAHAHTKYFMLRKVTSIVQQLSNKQSAKMICMFDRLRKTHNKSQKAI